MMGSTDQVQLMQNICRSMNAKKILEIGTFTGYTSLSLALALPDDARIISCDVNEERVKIANKFWKEAGVSNRVESKLGPAIDTINKLLESGETGTYDFIFIDADKSNQLEYYEKGLKLLRQGGLVVIDNVIWGGSVCDETQNSPDT